MTEKEILLRKALLHEQAAIIYPPDAERHLQKALQLREEAARLEDTEK